MLCHSCGASPENPNTQYLRLRAPEANQGMVFGTGVNGGSQTSGGAPHSTVRISRTHKKDSHPIETLKDWALGSLWHCQAQTKHGVLVRVFTPPGWYWNAWRVGKPCDCILRGSKASYKEYLAPTINEIFYKRTLFFSSSL